MQIGTLGTDAAEHRVVAGHAQQTQAHHQHAGDRAALEGDIERLVQALGGRLGGTHIGAHRHVHADVAGRARQDRAQREADRGGPAQAGNQAQHEEEHHADDADGAVLAVQVGLRAGLDGGGDLLHARVAGGQGQDGAACGDAIDDGDHAADQGEPQAC